MSQINPNTFIICGLGNPGAEYLLTRHNAGFIFVDFLKDKISSQTKFQSKWSSEYCKLAYKNFDIILVKPMTFMNLSGNSLIQVKNFFKVDINNIIVVHDDVDLKLDQIRFKQGGGSGGHNGLKSIDKMLGNNYKRLRIGVDKFGNTSDYVLSKFKNEELENLTVTFSNIIDNIELLFDKDLNKITTKLALNK